MSLLNLFPKDFIITFCKIVTFACIELTTTFQALSLKQKKINKRHFIWNVEDNVVDNVICKGYHFSYIT